MKLLRYKLVQNFHGLAPTDNIPPHKMSQSPLKNIPPIPEIYRHKRFELVFLLSAMENPLKLSFLALTAKTYSNDV